MPLNNIITVHNIYSDTVMQSKFMIVFSYCNIWFLFVCLSFLAQYFYVGFQYFYLKCGGGILVN